MDRQTYIKHLHFFFALKTDLQPENFSLAKFINCNTLIKDFVTFKLTGNFERVNIILLSQARPLAASLAKLARKNKLF
jgi:hypothetical protein